MFALQYLYLIIIVLIFDGNLDNFFAFYEEGYNSYSSSLIDQLSVVFMSISFYLSSLAFLFVFKCNAKSISDLCKDVQKLKYELAFKSIKLKEEQKPLKYFYVMEKSTRTMVYGQFFNLVASISWAIWTVCFYESNDEKFLHYGDSLRIVYPILVVMLTSLCLFGPMTCSAELVVGQIINSITDLFSQWNSILKCGVKAFPEDNVKRNQSSYPGNSSLELELDKM